MPNIHTTRFSLANPTEVNNNRGMDNPVMVFKVTLKDIFKRAKEKPYRLIAIESSDTLYDLASVIVDSFNFDFDHAFGFYDNLKNPYNSKVQYELFSEFDDDEEEEEEEELSEAEEAYYEALTEAEGELRQRIVQATLQVMKDTLLPRVAPRLRKEVEELIEEETARIEANSRMEADLITMLESAAEKLPSEAMQALLPFLPTEEPTTRSVKKTSIAEVFTQPGHKMLFLFDYGDDWRFEVELVRTEPRQSTLSYPSVLQRVGKAPKQYSDF